MFLWRWSGAPLHSNSTMTPNHDDDGGDDLKYKDYLIKKSITLVNFYILKNNNLAVLCQLNNLRTNGHFVKSG